MDLMITLQDAYLNGTDAIRAGIFAAIDRCAASGVLSASESEGVKRFLALSRLLHDEQYHDQVMTACADIFYNQLNGGIS